jgi:ADP-heptose:LPS heptosyltransferase
MFAAALAEAACVVCADSLALHLALAVGTPVVGIFCPTSAAEIEFYRSGEAVASGVGPCYKGDCPRWPGCMESITVERVMEAVGRRRAR